MKSPVKRCFLNQQIWKIPQYIENSCQCFFHTHINSIACWKIERKLFRVSDDNLSCLIIKIKHQTK